MAHLRRLFPKLPVSAAHSRRWVLRCLLEQGMVQYCWPRFAALFRFLCLCLFPGLLRFRFIRLDGRGRFRCNWLCFGLFQFRCRGCGGFREKPEHIQRKLLSVCVLPWNRLFFAGGGLCRRSQTAGGFFRLLGGLPFLFLLLLLPLAAFLLQNGFRQGSE